MTYATLDNWFKAYLKIKKTDCPFENMIGARVTLDCPGITTQSMTGWIKEDDAAKLYELLRYKNLEPTEEKPAVIFHYSWEYYDPEIYHIILGIFKNEYGWAFCYTDTVKQIDAKIPIKMEEITEFFNELGIKQASEDMDIIKMVREEIEKCIQNL